MPDALTDPNAVARALGQGVVATPTDVPWGPLSKQLGEMFLPQSMMGPSEADVNQYNQVMTDVEHGKYKPGKLPTPDIGQSPSAAADAFTKGALEGVGMFAGPPTAGGALKSMFIGPMGASRLKAAFNLVRNPMHDLEWAKMLDKQAVQPHDILHETGWFRAPDMRWKKEIPDNDLNVHVGPGYGLGPASSVSHPILDKIYPDLRRLETTVVTNAKDYAGRHSPPGDIYPGGSLYVQGTSPSEARSVAGHELQHAVQRQEGFAKGGDPGNKTLGALYNDVILKRPDIFSKIANAPDPERTKAAALWNMYKSLAGEVEARNVQHRLDFTPAQRFEHPPWETMDTPADAQMVLGLRGPTGEPQLAANNRSWMLNEAQKHNIADRYKAGEPVNSIANDYDIHPNMVYRHAMARGAEPRMARNVRNQYTGPAPEPPPDMRLPWNRPKLKEDYSRETMYNTLLTLQKLLGK